MKNPRCLKLMLCTMFVLACCSLSALGQSADKLAAISATASSVRWDVAAPNSGLTMTVSAPDGRVFQKEFRAGMAPEFMLSDKHGERMPDGVYTYELRLSPVLSAGAKEKLAAARGKDDDTEDVRATRKREVLPALVQSGSFSLVNGSAIVAGSAEEAGQSVSKLAAPRQLPSLTRGAVDTRSQQHHPLMITMPDDVIPDDLIVQGSACVGLDCVNGEVFGFDTIRLKENNTRLQFEDTSAAGFPLNNWQIRANSSAAGGASFLAFVDQGAAGNSETGTILFEVDAGAPANSLKVASNGKVGLRTATPVLDVHANTSDTPAIRLEQNNSGGFAAQTWDMAGNEANFFVRDVTGGSRLPFRIRPGAPTSSIDIAANGNVGINTGSPSDRLTVFGGAADVGVKMQTTNTGTTTSDGFNFGVENASQDVFFTQRENAAMRFLTNGAERITVKADGTVGIATTAPTQTLSVNGTAGKPGGGTWDVFSDERLKNIKGRYNTGLKAVMQLQPIRYEYKPNNALGIKLEGENIGFGAQSVQQVIPEAVTRNSEGYLMVKSDPILWTMLNAIKEQQQEIAELKAQVRKLQAASRKRR